MSNRLRQIDWPGAVRRSLADLLLAGTAYPRESKWSRSLCCFEPSCMQQLARKLHVPPPTGGFACPRGPVSNSPRTGILEVPWPQADPPRASQSSSPDIQSDKDPSPTHAVCAVGRLPGRCPSEGTLHQVTTNGRASGSFLPEISAAPRSWGCQLLSASQRKLTIA